MVLDPFMGSGSAAIAALRTGRHYLGYDTDEGYVAAAERRIAEERAALDARSSGTRAGVGVELPAVPTCEGEDDVDDDDALARAAREGRQAKELARILLDGCGFTNIRADVKPRGLGIELTFVATDATGRDWAFDVSGVFTRGSAGLRRADTLWKSLGKASVLRESGTTDMPLVLVTTDTPAKGSAGDRALRVMRGPGRPVFDVVELLVDADRDRLHRYACHGRPS